MKAIDLGKWIYKINLTAMASRLIAAKGAAEGPPAQLDFLKLSPGTMLSALVWAAPNAQCLGQGVPSALANSVLPYACYSLARETAAA